jgi:hypothetical protein
VALSVLACLLVGSATLAAQEDRPLRAVFPGYPETPKKRGIEIVLTVALDVDKSGLVTEATLVNRRKDSIPEIYFVGTLLDAVWQWKYAEAFAPRRILVRFSYKVESSDKPREDAVVFKPPSEVEIVTFKTPKNAKAPGAQPQ